MDEIIMAYSDDLFVFSKERESQYKHLKMKLFWSGCEIASYLHLSGNAKN